MIKIGDTEELTLGEIRGYCRTDERIRVRVMEIFEKTILKDDKFADFEDFHVSTGEVVVTYRDFEDETCHREFPIEWLVNSDIDVETEWMKFKKSENIT